MRFQNTFQLKYSEVVNRALEKHACIIFHRLRFTDISGWITQRASFAVINENPHKLFAFGDCFWYFSYIKVRFLLSRWIYCDCVLNLWKCQYFPHFPIYCSLLLLLFSASLCNWWKGREEPSTVLNQSNSDLQWLLVDPRSWRERAGFSQKVAIFLFCFQGFGRNK